MLNFKSVKSGLFLVAFITPQVLFAQNIALGVNSHIINQNIDQTKKSIILTKDLKMQYMHGFTLETNRINKRQLSNTERCER
ncbi:hypothetical protein [Klebsiella pneumoniae]|uniref:hypothetical protein n=1 Tax=Klebsiella pneumoniae TaxID=573 RepID=UPI00115E36EE|nr:hypothetical protein [Klebsiella pneumoniae]